VRNIGHRSNSRPSSRSREIETYFGLRQYGQKNKKIALVSATNADNLFPAWQKKQRVVTKEVDDRLASSINAVDMED
jgi:hypothetical protein